MGTDDIPLDKAEFLSVILEALLYGFSLFMFGGTMWALCQQSAFRVKCKMFTAASAFLLFSTAHLVIDIIRVMQGFILLPDTYPGGRIQFFSIVSHWTFVSKNYLYAAQTLIGDGVVIYRCYAVWQSKLVMILPLLLWCAVAVTGFGCPFTELKVTEGGVFDGRLAKWIISFWASTLTTNTVTTLMLAYRIWYVDRKTSRMGKSELRPILHVIVDAGGIYSVTLLVALICFANKSNGQYVILDMIMPIISITFYMVIIRVGLANRTNQLAQTQSFGHTCSGHCLSGNRQSRVQMDIGALNEKFKADNDRRSSVNPMSPTYSDDDRVEMKISNIEEEV